CLLCRFFWACGCVASHLLAAFVFLTGPQLLSCCVLPILAHISAAAGAFVGHFEFSRFAISLSRYQRAFFKSSIASFFKSQRHAYLTTFPRLNPMCSVTWMHSMPDGCDV